MTVVPLSSTKSQMAQATDPQSEATSVSIANLENLSIFQGLPEQVLHTIQETADYKFYKTGEAIFALGQYDGETFYILETGTLKVTVTNPKTGSVYIDSLEAGQTFGLEIILKNENTELLQNMTLTADQDTRLWIIDAASFLSIIANRPSLVKNVMYYLAQEMLKMRFRAFEVNGAPEQRVYDVLLSFIEQDKDTGNWHIPQMPKHRELAEMAEVDEAIAASAIASLIQDKIARREYPGLIIEDMGRLNQLAH